MLRTHRSLKASGATLWWRWEKDDRFFFIFPSNGAPVEWNWQGKTEVLGEKPVPLPLCPPQIPHGLTRNRTRASAVGSRRLTAWAMTRPRLLPSLGRENSKDEVRIRYTLLHVPQKHKTVWRKAFKQEPADKLYGTDNIHAARSRVKVTWRENSTFILSIFNIS